MSDGLVSAQEFRTAVAAVTPPVEETVVATAPHDSTTTQDDVDVHCWLAEHERALERMRSRVIDAEHALEAERDMAIPSALAASGIFALPLALSLPWLLHAGGESGTSGWALLLAPTIAPSLASAVYVVAAAVLLQGLALGVRKRATAVAAAAITLVASLTTIAFIAVVARDSDLAATTGPGVCVVILLVLAVTWGTIAELRRWA